MKEQKLKNEITAIIESTVLKAVLPRLKNSIANYEAGNITPAEMLADIEKAASILQ